MRRLIRAGGGTARPPASLWIAASGWSAAAGLGASLTAVTACTVLVFALREVAPVLSLGVIYLLAVLLVSSNWGRSLGVLTAVGSALAFDFFHLPPTGSLSVTGSENVVGLVAFLVAAVSAGAVADSARRRACEAEERRRESDLGAELARTLLGAEPLTSALSAAARRLALALDLPSAAIELHPVEGDDRNVVFPLRSGARSLGTLTVPAGLPESALSRLQRRVVPSLEAVLAAALEREELQTEVVNAAALRRGDTVKTALLRTVSHDLRSPLTAIATAGEGLGARTITDADRRELAAVVTEEAARLTRLIDNLLDLSKLDAGAAVARREWIALDDVLHAAAGHVHGTFAFALDSALPLVRADAAQLERAFANILENAARHGGGHPVSVRARNVGSRLLVRVVDRGPGIPPAQLERVFEPFFQAGTGGTRGSGLGLSIARGFIEANRGRLSAESFPGQGTSFVCELPLETPPDPGPRPAGGAAAAPRA